MIDALQRSVLFPTHLVRAPAEPRTLPSSARQIHIDTDEGKVEGWYLEGEGRNDGAPGPAVVFAHGNAEIIDQWPELMAWYAERGIGALLAEYRGYGRSSGNPTADKIAADFRLFGDWLAARPEVDSDRLIYHGRSLGGGAVCRLAESRPPAALILQSTFTSVADLAWDHYKVPQALIGDKFPNDAIVADYDGPTLVVHGVRDDIVPVEHGRRLREAASRAAYVELDGGHNDTTIPWERVERFLGRHALLED